MTELGWTALLIDEEYGGLGGSFLDFAIILEELGKALLPGPFFSTMMSGLLLQEAASQKMKEAYLSGIAAGELLCSLAISGMEDMNLAAEGLVVKASGEHSRISGTALFVPFAHISDTVISAARIPELEDVWTLFLVHVGSPKVKVSPMKAIGAERLCAMTLDDEEIPADRILGEKGKGLEVIRAVWPKMITSRCLEMTGAIHRVLEMTVQYVNERRQFGRPLAAFQAVQFLCADIAIQLESSKVIAWHAARAIDEGLSCYKESAMAKAWCSEALKLTTKMAHQAHGGIGFTEEHDLHLFTKQAKVWEVTFGDANCHRETVAAAIAL
jgi:alkylation response protein AidB-like acyl-CoA dehydrogenase